MSKLQLDKMLWKIGEILSQKKSSKSRGGVLDMTSQVKPIHGKVARVLNAQEVALNRGAVDGVEVGMIFKILSEKGSAIKDPDTDELLGSVEVEKTSVKVTSVQERVSVASTYREYKVNVGGSGIGLLARGLFEPPKWETHVETLRIEENTKEELEEEDTYVKTGDPVVQDLSITQAIDSRLTS